MVEEAVEKDGDVVVIVVEEEGEDDGEDVLIATLPTGGIVDFQKFKGISTREFLSFRLSQTDC